MALDLSNVTENGLDVSDLSVPSNCVLLPADLITLPGRNDIPFHISESGNLILANFLIDLTNGIPVLKGWPSAFGLRNPSKPTISDKVTDTNDARRLFVGSDSSDYWSRVPAVHSLEPMDQSVSIDSKSEASAYPLVLTTNHGNSNQQQQSDLSLTEEPVDATMHRRQNSLFADTSVSKRSTSDQNKPTPFLSQSVCELLAHHGYPWKDAEPRSDLIIEGHNMSELVRFVDRLKRYRLRAGMTQSELSLALVDHFNDGNAFSQVLLSRFERLEVTVRSAFRLLPRLQTWLNLKTDKSESIIQEFVHPDTTEGSPKKALGKSRTRKLLRLGLTTDHRLHRDSSQQAVALLKPDSNYPPLDHHPTVDADPDSQPAVRSNSRTPFERIKRTHFSEAVLRILADEYKTNPRPKGAHLTRLAVKTGCRRESIRIWFCNRRQADAHKRVVELSGQS